MNRIKSGTLCFMAMLLLAGCTSADRTIETPSGGQSAADVGGPLVILGVVPKATSTKNLSGAPESFVEIVEVNVPVGTVAIVPVVTGWSLGFGSVEPDDLSSQPSPNQQFLWHSDDHHLGLARVDLSVQDINAVNPATNTQTATIRVLLRLSDHNTDDAWFGLVTYTLLCLGKTGDAPVAGAPATGAAGPRGAPTG